MAGRRPDLDEGSGRVKRQKTEEMDKKYLKHEDDDSDQEDGGVPLFANEPEVTGKTVIDDLKKDRKCCKQASTLSLMALANMRLKSKQTASIQKTIHTLLIIMKRSQSLLKILDMKVTVMAIRNHHRNG